MPPLPSDEIPTEHLVERVIDGFQKLHALGDKIKAEIRQFAFRIILNDNEVLLAQGTYCKVFYFVCDGLLISDSTHHQKTITTWFAGPGFYVTSISGLYGKSPSAERIFASGRTVLLAFDVEHILRWYTQFPESNVIMRVVFENYLQMAQQRASIIRMGTAREKYAYYMSNRPGYVHNVPIESIASYLGIKLASLQRVMREQEKALGKKAPSDDQYQQVKLYVEKQQLYLQTAITLGFLANELKIKPFILSALINRHGKQNFNDFINEYRVQYVMIRLKDKQHLKKVKLESIGKEAGFSSRSSFFAAFKKFTGVSPAVHLKSMVHLSLSNFYNKQL